jgi:predicted glycosyltransferase
VKILFFINTEAQVHTWRHVIRNLMDKGHEVKILARDYRYTLELLHNHGFKYSSFKPIKLKYLKIFEILVHVREGYRLSQKFDPSIIVGFGVGVALTGALLRKPCLVFTDTEPIPLQHFLTKLLAEVILTPSCFKKEMGKKHIHIAGYKELAYLHPHHFSPDSSIYNELGINKNEKYVILRFNVFDAFHDIGKHGFSIPDKYQLIKELGKYARVFVSAEGSLPQDLEGSKLLIPFHRIHHALYYAQLVVADTGTMVTEAAVLGTPGLYCGPWTGICGNFIELEQEYDLIYCFREPKETIQKALELLQQDDLKEKWTEKRNRLLQDKMDVTDFMVWFIENYPHSFEEFRGKQVRAMK